jgi:hypothetical protein
MFLASVERLITSVVLGRVILVTSPSVGVGVGMPRITSDRCVVDMPVEVAVGVGVAVTAAVCVGIAVGVGVDCPLLPQPIAPDTSDNTSSGITTNHNFFMSFLLSYG